MGFKYDFSGWATKNNILCSDGRTIMKDAFKEQDGTVVPLVWMHQHDSIDNVLGHALLKNTAEGVRAYCKFNDSEEGQAAKLRVESGDINSLSIHAGRLKQDSRKNVIHGKINEVSLVLAGANDGALIDTLSFAHGEDSDIADECEYYPMVELTLEHGEIDYEEEHLEHAEEKKPEPKKEEGMNEDEEKKSSGKTISDIYNSMSDEQKDAVAYMVGAALESKEGGEDEKGLKEDEENMKHSVFDAEQTNGQAYISHADQEGIISLAKTTSVGSLQDALEIYAQDNELSHADIAAAGGFIQPTEGLTGDVTTMFPEYKDVKPGAPELITNDQTWISTVLNGVHKSPISRIRTRHVDIRNIEALRAKGYKKGTQKKLTGNFKAVQRTTDPQTIYVKNALHRDDIVDITDFDYVSYLYNIDRMMLNEELATAIVFGDGRDDADPDKISEEHIRPIYLDDDLYTIHKTLDLATAKATLQGSNTSAYFSDNYVYAEAMIEAVLYARETYKGSGSPIMLMAPHTLNVMLLARDMNGRRIYNDVKELAAAFNVSRIETVEQMADKTRTADNKTYRPLAIMCNFSDYHLGSTKGGQITHFTQFDIDFNQEKSLIETRCSGANTRVYSAIAIEEEVKASGAEG